MPGGAIQRDRVIRDPIYGYITIPHRLCPLVDHPAVQRLRRIAQNSLAVTVYPSLSGSRFEHALGAMHLAMLAWTSAWDNSPDTRREFRDAIRKEVPVSPDDAPMDIRDALAAVALLHDVGHPPLSHALERYYDRHADELTHHDAKLRSLYNQCGKVAFHEFAGLALVDQVVDDTLPEVVADLVRKIYSVVPGASDWRATLKAVIAGEIDVDRIDYLVRDAYRSGTEYGAIDYQRLLGALEIHLDAQRGVFEIAPSVRARSAAESLLVLRTQAHRWVYLHPRVVSADYALLRAVTLMTELASSESETTDASQAARIQTAFGEIMPELNYLAPNPNSAIAPFDSAPQGAALFEPEPSGIGYPWRPELSATVDDSTVWEWLKNGWVVARSIVDQFGAGSPVVEELLTYLSWILFRRKNCFPAWKTYDEYADVASALRRSGIATLVEDAMSELVRQYDAEERWKREIASAQRDTVLAICHSAHHVAMFNYFASLMGDGQRLADHLNSVAAQQRRQRGFWSSVTRDFSSLSRGRQFGVLYRDQERIMLRSTSPLVENLEQVDAMSIRLFVYYHVPSYNREGADVARTFRKGLREAVVAHFGQVLRRELHAAQRETIQALIDIREGERDG